ncbi:hypothetical protein D1133_10330 [Turicibacter sp. TS3]|nr:hypothetical protein [Turicibacter sp. TS3]
MKDTLSTPYTYGPSEGVNNKIKVIKRIAFEYRDFITGSPGGRSKARTLPPLLG